MTNLAHLAKIRPDSDLLPAGSTVYLPKTFFLELENWMYWKHKRMAYDVERAELGSLLTCLQNHGRNSGVY